MDHLTGHCLCGAVRYAFPRDRIAWQGLCSCESCRRASGAPVVGWIGLAREALDWTGEAPRTYASSPGVTRSFCATCGTPLAFATAKRPDQIDILAATLSDPSDYSPDRQFFAAEALDWPGLHITLPEDS